MPWSIVNDTQFKAANLFYMDGQTGDLHYLVAVKGTYDINPDSGETMLSDEQVDVFPDPQFREEAYKSSLMYDSDLVPIKQKVDVILNAQAYANNGGKPDKRVEVGISIGSWTKKLIVVGSS